MAVKRKVLKMARIPIEEMDEKETEDLVQYISQKVEYMKKFLRLGADTEVNFYELQRALVEYSNIHNSLISMSTITRFEHSKAKEDFTSWYSEKFIEIRNNVNSPDKPASKYMSATEIEYMVRTEFKDEFKKLKDEEITLEHKHHFVKELVKMWEGHNYVLSTLSSNLRSEVGSLSRG
jgi:hypothetical protein